MCGIVGYIGNKKASNIFLNGLKRLEYRGYDSAGISTYETDKILTTKYSGKVKDLENKIKSKGHEGKIGMGHTRWATHGKPTDINAHPHHDTTNKISIVHNGIVENYYSIKKYLSSNDYTFKSETDSEVIVNLLSYEWKKNNDFKVAINKTINQLEGTYALCILNITIPNKLFCVCNGSPLLISKTEKECYIASEQSGLMLQTNSYICIQNKNIIEISINQKNNVEIKTNREL